MYSHTGDAAAIALGPLGKLEIKEGSIFLGFSGTLTLLLPWVAN